MNTPCEPTLLDEQKLLSLIDWAVWRDLRPPADRTRLQAIAGTDYQ